jgi:uncharacterized protein YjbJ (UPF0337 family)
MTNTNPNPNMNKPASVDTDKKLSAKIKETWGKLGDEDIKLYSGNREQFFAKLQEKQGVSKEDAEKKIQEIEKSVGHRAA